MRTLLDIVWPVLCGSWMAVGYLLAGVICCVLVDTIPFGIASFRIAGYALRPVSPLGHEIVQRGSARSVPA